MEHSSYAIDAISFIFSLQRSAVHVIYCRDYIWQCYQYKAQWHLDIVQLSRLPEKTTTMH